MHTLDQLRAGELAGSRRLDLSCGLTEFPEEIFQLAETLEVLNLSGNALRDLPPDLPRLHHLRVLFCSSNAFTHLPTSIGGCGSLHTVGFKANRIDTVDAAALPASLRALILTDNALDHLPDGISHCTHLLKLMLSGNRLERLPGSLATCRELELLRIAANRFQTLPTWLEGMPRLWWLACGGNPLAGCENTAVDESASIGWADLKLGERLGEGASGLIHRAEWRPSDGGAPRSVAVKLFKGHMTSDGSPHSEMAASLRAGEHPHLIGALGRVEGHPEGAPGLVMPLVDAACQVLSGPPSLDSCTRDVYPAALRLSNPALHRLALGVARAMAHLHARGLLHGDLYAHNILWDGAAQVLLGDFGAAATLPQFFADRLQRLEIGAFGCLLEDLLARRAGDERSIDDGPLLPLVALRERCMDAEVRARSSFAEIVSSLEAMSIGSSRRHRSRKCREGTVLILPVAVGFAGLGNREKPWVELRARARTRQRRVAGSAGWPINQSINARPSPRR